MVVPLKTPTPDDKIQIKMYAIIGLCSGVVLINPSSLLTAIFAIQPRKTIKINKSSNLTTIFLPFTAPIASSGDKSMEKMSSIKAKSVLTKAIKKTIGATRIIKGKKEERESGLSRKNTIERANNNKTTIMLKFNFSFFIGIITFLAKDN